MKQLTEEDKKRLMRKLPSTVVSVLSVVTLYFSMFGTVKVVSLALTHYFGREVYLMPYLFFKFDGVALYMIPIVAIPAIYSWLLGTRTQRFSTPKMRVFGFFNSLWAVSTMVTAYGMTKLQDHLLPFFYERLGRVIETDDAVTLALFSKVKSFFLLVELLPVILMIFIGMFIVTRYRRHDAEMKQAFLTYKWTGERLRKFENLEKATDFVVEYPDIELGINRETKEMVVLPGFDRTLNTAIVGSIGTGKTAALGLPAINQDLHYFTKFINESPKLRTEENYVSEEIQGRFLNGLSIIEPSNDLCKKVYQLAKAHGIADEAITYIDPTNPNTPGLNFLKGPVEKVSEVFAQVLAGLADNGGGGNFYFEQAQRSHLKQHIYLLKLHKDEEVTFDDLMRMYEDANIVHNIHLEFKKRIREKFPEGEKEQNLRDNRDRYNEWLLYTGIDKWFENVIVLKTDFQGAPAKDIHGQFQYIDLFEKDVKGLRNILTDIGRNPLLARVLNGKSEFDFDKHMGGEGGILLVNTAKGQLEALGATLGKMVLMTLQNASFRREPNVSPFHHILIDEAPEYYYGAFASFPAQSRKFKVIITTLQQTLTQLRGAFGEDYMNNVIAAMRNRMVYADVSNFDGDYFSKMFGEKEVYQEGETEQVVSPLQDDPGSRSGSTYQKVKEAALTSGDILFQEAFECAVKIVINNKTMPVQQIKANFVPKDEFKEAVVKVDSDAMNEWIELRYNSTELVMDEALLMDEEELAQMQLEQAKADRILNEQQTAAGVAPQQLYTVKEEDRALDVSIPAVPKANLENVVKPSERNKNATTGHEQVGLEGNQVELPKVNIPIQPPKAINKVVVPTTRKTNNQQKKKVEEVKAVTEEEKAVKAPQVETKQQVQNATARTSSDESKTPKLDEVSIRKRSPKEEKGKEQVKTEVAPIETEVIQTKKQKANPSAATEVNRTVEDKGTNEGATTTQTNTVPQQKSVKKSSIIKTEFIDNHAPVEPIENKPKKSAFKVAPIEDPSSLNFSEKLETLVDDVTVNRNNDSK